MDYRYFMREAATELFRGEDGSEVCTQDASGHEAVWLAEQRYTLVLLDLACSGYQLRDDENIHSA